MVVGLGSSLEFFWGFPGIDTLEDTKLAEVLEGQLKFTDGFGPADILDDFSPFASLHSLHSLLMLYIDKTTPLNRII